MGATDHYQTITGKTADEAFRAAQEQARYEHGSGGYTGSLAEARGYLLLRTGPLLEWEAMQRAQKALEDGTAQKWGPAILVPIAEPVATRKMVFTVPLSNDQWDTVNAGVKTAVLKKLRDGEGVVSLHSAVTMRNTQITAKSTAGATRNMYCVSVGFGETKRFATLTEAKTWAKKYLEADRHRGEGQLTIVKVTDREDGQPLAVVKKQTTSAVAEVTALVGKPSKAPVTRWIAAGIYSC